MPISLFSCNFHFTPRAAYPSLRGLWFFTGTPTAFISYDREVSVPLRDYGSSLFVSYLNFISIVKFPSPYGIMVLHSTPYQWLNYAIENGVCGADFIFRLFSAFSLKISFKNPQRPPFHHIGAEWYKTYEICLYYTILLKFFVEYRKYFFTPPVKGLAMMRSYAGLNTIRDLHHLFPIKKT